MPEKGWASLNKFIQGGWGGAEGGKRWAKGPIERPSDCMPIQSSISQSHFVSGDCFGSLSILLL
jgi:hypothetical protein